MRKVIKNGIVIFMNLNKKEKYKKCDIVIDDNVITDICDNYIGNSDLVIDASNKIVMPGLINTHTHSGMSIFRASNDSLNLNDWLNKFIWPVEAKLTSEDIYYTTLYSCLEMIKTGTTTFNEMYINNDGFIKAFKESKMRAMYGSNFMDIGGKGESIINDFKKTYEENKNNELITFNIGAHSFYTCSKEYLKRCSDLALNYNLPVHIHFCENENEVKGIKENYGNLYNALNETGLLRNKLILAHCTFVDDETLNKLKGKDITFVHNPLSNLNLGCGIADISKYSKDFNISLGTDGAGSGNNLNMFYHMSLVDLLQKGMYKDPCIMSSYDVLKMATINGSKALGLDKEIGSIEINKKADIIILDMNNIECYPSIDLINNIVHNSSYSNVDTTIINGEILMQNHKILLDIDENKLKFKLKEMIEKNFKGE